MTEQVRTVLRGGAAGVLGAALLVAACGGSQQAPSPDVWAMVNGQPITRDDVEKAYRRLVEPTETEPTSDEVLAVKMNIIEELISQTILQMRAEAEGVAATDAEVDAAYAERTADITPAAFQQQLSERGLTPDDLRSALRRELSVQKLVDRDVVSRVQIADEEVTTFYNQNRDRFNLPEAQFRLAQIVITPERGQAPLNRMGDDAGSAAEARRKLDMLMEKLKAGADFGNLAADYSEDPQTAAVGGDLGFVPESALEQAPPAMRDVVSRTAAGNVGTVTVGGTHTILFVVSKEPAGQRELSSPEVRDGIREMLRDQREQLLRAAYVAAARNEADVVNYLARQLVDTQGAPPAMAPAAPSE